MQAGLRRMRDPNVRAHQERNIKWLQAARADVFGAPLRAYNRTFPIGFEEAVRG